MRKYMGDFNYANKDCGCGSSCSSCSQMSGLGYMGSFDAKKCGDVMYALKYPADCVKALADGKIQAELDKQKAALTSQANAYLTTTAQTYLKDPKVQDKGIDMTFQKMADYVKSVRDSIKAGTLMQNHKTMVFTVTGVTGLLAAKWLLGPSIAKYMASRVKANPNYQKKYKFKLK